MTRKRPRAELEYQSVRLAREIGRAIGGIWQQPKPDDAPPGFVTYDGGDTSSGLVLTAAEIVRFITTDLAFRRAYREFIDA